MVLNKQALMLLALLSLTACASQYAPLTTNSKHAGGYQALLLEDELINDEASKDYPNENQPRLARYLLTYQGTTSDTTARITHFWHQRANELCPNGYKVESHKQTIVYGTIRSPVNGMMVNLGTEQPIDRGIIQCIE